MRIRPSGTDFGLHGVSSRRNGDRRAHSGWSEHLHRGRSLPRCSHVEHEEELLYSFEVRNAVCTNPNARG